MRKSRSTAKGKGPVKKRNFAKSSETSNKVKSVGGRLVNAYGDFFKAKGVGELLNTQGEMKDLAKRADELAVRAGFTLPKSKKRKKAK